jgi:hypothetical protein
MSFDFTLSFVVYSGEIRYAAIDIVLARRANVRDTHCINVVYGAPAGFGT